jgi:hypothetical protein
MGAWSVSDYATRQFRLTGRLRPPIRPGTQHVITFQLTTKTARLRRDHKQLVAHVRLLALASRRGPQNLDPS